METEGLKLEDIPEEVIAHYILPWLQPNDLLRLRRVSKYLKLQADDYIRLHDTTTRYVDVDPLKLAESSIAVPVSRAYIQNMENYIWDPAVMKTFALKCGNKITHLRVDCLDIPLASNEIEYFENFPNLEHLEVGGMFERNRSDQVERWTRWRAKYQSDACLVPSSFKRLKRLSIYYYKSVADEMNSVRLVWEFMHNCSARLEYVHHPKINLGVTDRNWGDPLGQGPFGFIRILLEEHQDLKTFRDTKLKCYDLEHYSFEDSHISDFYELVTVCAQNDVKLYNVTASAIEKMMIYTSWDMKNHPQKISAVVASLQSMSPSTFLIALPRLEKLKIKIENSHESCCIPEMDLKRCALAELQELDILIYAIERDDHVANFLLNFLFVGIRRENVTTLIMEFKVRSFLEPPLRNVYVSCPNIKMVYLVTYPGNNDDISQMWNNLPLLQEIEFNECYLDDQTFIGPDFSNPSILKARNLKHLAILKLKEASKITDSLFKNALRHMPLKRIWITGNLGNLVTINGLSSLLNGAFADNIEQLSITEDLSLKNGNEELSILESKFRSAQMF